MRVLAAAVSLLLLTSPLSAQERRPMTTDDALDMVRIGDALISPDGSWVLFSKSELDWDENERTTTWWRVSADGSDEPYRFIGEEGGQSFRFSPDGSRLAFLREVDDDNQLFVMRTNGGEAEQLSEHETAVGSFEWGESGSTIYYLATHARSDEEQQAREDGADAIFVDEGPNGQRDGQWNDLWAIDLTTKDGRRITERDHLIASFSIAPDERRLVYTARTENRRNQENLAEVHLLDMDSGDVRVLTDNESPESRLAWSPDGSRIAYAAPSDEEWDLQLTKLWTIEPESGRRRLVSGGFQGNIGYFDWTPDGSAILFGGLQGTNTNLYRLEMDAGAVEQVTRVEGSLAPSSFSGDGSRMAYVLQSFGTPPDVGAGPTDGAAGTRLTDANPWIANDRQLGSGELIRWRSTDGLEIEGILMLPEGYEGGRLPLLLHIHGGPAGVFRNAFVPQNHVWAGLGYAQLFPNVRGSSGYTDELLRGNMNDIGGGDYEDLMTGVDEVIARGIADQDQLGVRGWSYGGILGGWTITRTSRFKGASLGAMVSDWTSEYGPGFNFDVRRWYIGDTPWENPDEWRQRSPLTHVADVTTPTLLLHGIADRTDTEAQSMMFFQALKDQGKTARYIRFPREPHAFQEPRHIRTRDVEEIRWIQTHVRGIQWEPWERPRIDAGTEDEEPIVQ